MDGLKAYQDDPEKSAIIGALGGGAVGAIPGIKNMIQEYRKAQGPLLDDGNVLSLRARKPNLGKYLAQNPYS